MNDLHVDLLPRNSLLVDGRLLLEDRLGEGSMGEVWRAMDLELRTHVALKLLAPRLLGSTAREKHIDAFLREGSLGQRVDCPHVVHVFECGSSPELGPYIVMELLEGQDLSDQLAASGTLELTETATIIAQLCLALEALHAADVFHRDVKPENVIVTTRSRRPCAKLIDFSIARDGSSCDDEEGIFGTPAYLSPERLAGSSVGRAPADLWALAVVAYQCLMGKVPFDDSSVATVCVAVNRGTFLPPSAFVADVPAGLDAWFGRAFARSLSDRFASATEMREALIQAWAPFPLEVPTSERDTASRAARRASGVPVRLPRGETPRRNVA